MKKITLLLVLLFSIGIFAQSKKDIRRRTSDVIKFTRDIRESNKYTSDSLSYSLCKIYALKDVTLSKEKQVILAKLFLTQWKSLVDATERYETINSAASKVDLIKVLLDNEEEFRKLLTTEEVIEYRRYGDKINTSNEFDQFFFSDYELDRFKKELQ